MIRKFHEAKVSETNEVTLWGDGSPYREFLYNEDLAPLINNSGAGFISVNGEDETLFKNAKLLLENVDLRKKIGHNGYQLLKNEFDVQKIAKQIVHTTGKENS
jgi:glycosyltransferase involved in cell wall biosynthesis